jgi:hypothetical protein
MRKAAAAVAVRAAAVEAAQELEPGLELVRARPV